jgi:hypothetical protein
MDAASDDGDSAEGFRWLSQRLWFRLVAVGVLFGLPFNLVFGLQGSRALDFDEAWRQMGSYPEGNRGPCRSLPDTLAGQLAAVWGHDPFFVIASVLGPVALFAGLLLLTRPWGAWARGESPRARAFAFPLALVVCGSLGLAFSLLAVLYADLIS